MPLKLPHLDQAMAIVSDRLRLVPVNMTYAEALFAAFTPEVTTYMLPASATAIEETQAFINSAIAGRQQSTELVVVILDKETGEFLGTAGLHDLHTAQPALGIWLKTAAHGNAYGVEAIGALIAWARANVDFEYLKYPVDRRNIPSRRIPETYAGVIRAEYKEMNRAGNELDLIEYWIQ